MKPRILLAESTTPDGAPMSLYEHDGAYSISFQGQELMHSKASASELLLGKLGVELARKEPKSRVMIGGLGLGFTLRTVLEGLGADAQVDVVELVPKVVEWNRDFLKDLNGALLDGPRVKVIGYMGYLEGSSWRWSAYPKGKRKLPRSRHLPRMGAVHT